MAGRLPEHFIDDLLSRVDIVDLIESHLPLRKAGRDFQALCPFHGEKTPSFTVSREKQFYHCFGCGAHGTAIGFLMQHRNLEFLEAVEELAAMAGVEIPRETRRDKGPAARDLYEVLERARDVYEQQLRRAASRERAVAYLKGRGITGEIAKQFRLGFAPDGWRNLYDALNAAGISDERLERAGLVIKRDRGGYYDRFRDRIMFPIHDRRGRVVGFGGRILDAGEPKYLNSPETEVFHKGRELYGLFEALATGNLRSLMVVEGYMDVIALHQHGLNNAVASLGTALTGDHLEQLFRHVPEIVFCFDGDAAGRRAAWKALESALPRMADNRQVRFAFLPDGHDPDTAVREFGADGFFAATRSFGLAEFLLETLKADVDLNSADGRTRLVARAATYLNQIPDQAHRATGARLLAEASRFDEELIRQRLGFGARHARGRRPAASLDRYASRTLEEHSAALLLQQPALSACLEERDAEILRHELDSCATLLDLWEHARQGAATTARLLERFRGSDIEAQLHELAALPLGIAETAMETEMQGAVQRLLAKGRDQRFQRIMAVPLREWSAADRDFVANYKRHETGSSSG